MNDITEEAGTIPDRGLIVAVVEEHFDASADEVFAAWIEPALLEEWWGPDGFSTRVLCLEAHEGGAFAYQMTAPSGASCVMRGRFLCVEKPHRLIMEVTDHCNIDLPPAVEMQVETTCIRVEFSPFADGTRVTVQHSRLVPGYAEIARESWFRSIARLLLRMSHCPQ